MPGTDSDVPESEEQSSPSSRVFLASAADQSNPGSLVGHDDGWPHRWTTRRRRGSLNGVLQRLRQRLNKELKILQQDPLGR